jgi:oxaloacetate decarboxylase gamma subunit|tara:strand:+ start:9448 stop:9723 length:276 start_codon:yes stop_codon:yes gene_type:complete
VREDELFMQGVELMLFGVSAVVIFLSLLVLVIGLASRVILRFFPEPAPAVPQRHGRTASGTVVPDAQSLDAERVAVIAAAVHQHRQRRRTG